MINFIDSGMSYTIYLISNFHDNEMRYKIGFTSRKVEQRIKEFQTGNSADFNILKTFICEKHHRKVEAALHRHFQNKKKSGEWFALTYEDVNNFIDTCKLISANINCVMDSNTYLEDRGIF